MRQRIIITAVVIIMVCAVNASSESAVVNPYAEWTHGPLHDAGFFPIAVWLQNPSNAGRYRAAGFNTYVGLWRGPTEKQLSELKKAGMKVICHQNEVGLSHVDDPTIIGWMQVLWCL